MTPYLIAAALLSSGVGSLVFSTLTYSLRELSRVRLADYLDRRGRARWVEPTTRYLVDLVFVTAVMRMLSNTALLLSCLSLADVLFVRPAARYGFAGGLAVVLTLFTSILIPDTLTRHVGNAIVGASVAPLHALRVALTPVTRLLHLADRLARRVAGVTRTAEPEPTPQQDMEQEILSAVEEGEKEGIVDEEQREMIESVIEFRDTTAGQIMTPRPEVVALEQTATLAQVKQVLEESGHSRLPVYDGTLDHCVGILYARDVLKHLGQPPDGFDVRATMRPAFFVPEVKPVRDLLRDFKHQQVHIALVLDEYGGAVGLITIEDILEELVGDIADEHEPIEPAMFHRVDENTAEADARIYVDELNRQMDLDLPEDDAYDTLAGYVLQILGRIPEKGTTFERDGARFTVLAAEPQKVSRVKIDLLPQAVPAGNGVAGSPH